MTRHIGWLLVFAILCPLMAQAAPWQPAKGRLLTRWAKDVSPEHVHPEYPRPQMTRERWQNLNGLWDYAVADKQAEQPKTFSGQILVPFPIESALSGVMQRVSDQQRLWYRRTFNVPQEWRSQRVLLHFGAVDWESTVWVNGKQLEVHRGGYDPFSFDITDALADKPEQEIVVAVWDPSDKGTQPRGKQVQRPEGIWYTPTTGIWQTVWIEPAPATGVRELKITPDVDRSAIEVIVRCGSKPPGLSAEVSFEGKPLRLRFDQIVEESVKDGSVVKLVAALPKDQQHLWSPDNPQLYQLAVFVRDDDKMIDQVGSYFGLRKIALGKDAAGLTRIMLNGEPLFQFGPLDQGFWPDGLYTAPTDEALRYDIEVTKQLGFNMARKHVKVEPARWYYWCDKLGLMVWQDMPSGDASVAPGRGEIRRTAASKEVYDRELTRMIEKHWNHPSIVMWVPFNEGWGQFETGRVVQLVKGLDPTRLCNCASGWNDMPVGDVHDIHVYPGPGSPKPEEHRAAVLGEYGGLGLPVRGHTWQDEKNWGYRSYTDAASLTDAYRALCTRLHPLVRSPGLSAAVYTQTTDVEIEVNGLLTYDRAQIKPDAAKITAANRQLYEAPPIVETVLPTAQQKEQTWRYTVEKPADGWFETDFDAAGWREGTAGFGTKGTPGAVINTIWNTPDIWLRREVELPDLAKSEPVLIVNHDEDVEIYINGVLAAKAKGYVNGYEDMPLSEAARKALRKGKNVLAVHCKQTTGGQAIDVGLARRVAADLGWKSLFDGKTLAGWKVTEFAGHNEVEVKDGTMVLLFGNELTGVTWKGEPTPKMNYELSLDAQRVDGNDFFCGLTFPYGDSPCSLILGGWGGGVVGLSSINGRDAANNATTKYHEFEKGRWYHVRLRVTPSRIEAWLDDEQIVDADTTDKTISIRPEVEASRPLGIASYSTTAALKNIQIRSLKK